MSNRNRKFESIVQSWKESNPRRSSTKRPNINISYWLQSGKNLLENGTANRILATQEEQIEVSTKSREEIYEYSRDPYHDMHCQGAEDEFNTPRSLVISRIDLNVDNGDTDIHGPKSTVEDGFGVINSSTVPDSCRKRESNRATMPFRRHRNSSKKDNVEAVKKRDWKSCIDPKSGRTYYYDVRTRETQWRKPIELASHSERRRIEDKEAQQKDFFKSMEANILKALDSGTISKSSSTESQDEVKELKEIPKRPLLTNKKKPTLIRTISSMDDNVLADLAQAENMEIPISMDIVSPDSTATSFFNSLPQPTVHSHHRHPLKNTSPSVLKPIPAQVTPPRDELSKAMPKPKMEKRNTCGSLYITNTMSAPDKEATIKCVCGVFRTHIVRSLKDSSENKTKFEDYEVFNDDYDMKIGTNRGGSRSTYLVESEMCIEMMKIDCAEEVPTLDDIASFYRFVFYKAQMESDCIIISLIYVERLMRETNGGVRPNARNWRSVLFSTMVLSSKVWDDLSMWNADFSLACPEGVSFSLQRINQLELALLTCFKYNVKVPASEYAKYYFLMRSMLIRSGLAGQDVLSSSEKLDTEGAQKLEFLSSNYKIQKPTMLRRSRSDAPKSNICAPKSSLVVNLEQVVRM